MLAEDLAVMWEEYFGQLPTFNTWPEARSTPFMKALDFILREIEPNKNYNDGTLGKIAQHALAHLRKQKELSDS